MVEDFLEDVRSYVGFGAEEATVLAELGRHAEPDLAKIAEHFYERMLDHPGAIAVFEDLAQVERLKASMVDWLRTGLAGPHDEAFFERRLRIGRVHVRVGLPQRYMFTAMNVIRLDLHALIERVHGDHPVARRASSDAVNRWLDLELTIMLESFKEHSEALLSRKERLAGIGQVVGTIGHELRNPLGVIESSLFLIRRKLGAADPGVDRHLDKIGRQVGAANEIISDLLDLIRDRPIQLEVLALEPLFDQISESAARSDAVRLRFHDELSHRWMADSSLLERALLNLVNNAVQAYEGRAGVVDVWATEDTGRVVLSVEDEGPGYDADLLPELLEPLITTRAGGSGLGLALVRRVAERHGGTIELSNRPEGGARARLILPLAKAKEAHPDG